MISLLTKYGYISDIFNLKTKESIHYSLISYYNILRTNKMNGKKALTPKAFAKLLYKRIQKRLQTHIDKQDDKNIPQTQKKTQKKIRKQFNILLNTPNKISEKLTITKYPLITNIFENKSTENNDNSSDYDVKEISIYNDFLSIVETKNTISTQITLQLFPFDQSSSFIMDKTMYNPFLELTSNINKKVGEVIHYLQKKWCKVRELYSYDLSLYDESGKLVINNKSLVDLEPLRNKKDNSVYLSLYYLYYIKYILDGMCQIIINHKLFKKRQKDILDQHFLDYMYLMILYMVIVKHQMYLCHNIKNHIN